MAKAKPKSKLALPSPSRQWKAILKSVSMDDIPINFISNLTIVLLDESEIYIDVDEMLRDEYDIEFILKFVTREIRLVQPNINRIDYIINIGAVATVAKSLTNDLFAPVRI